MSSSRQPHLGTETTEQLIERRFEEIRRGVTEAIRREVEWLERHNFPVWVARNGEVVDASKARDEEADD